MSLFVESGIEFDFTRALTVLPHDSPLTGPLGFSSSDGNTTWPGVDFRIENANGWIWLEVKSWEPGRVAPKRRGGNRRSFSSKMRSKVFGQEMRGKFLGTSAYLAWGSQFLIAPTRFILLFEPPTPLDEALLGPFMDILAEQFSVPRKWQGNITVAAMSLSQWNRRFPDYPARIV